MDSVDSKTQETLPVYYGNSHSLNSTDDRRARRRKTFRKITLILSSVFLFAFLLKDFSCVKHGYSSLIQATMDPVTWPIPGDLQLHDCPEVRPDVDDEDKSFLHFEQPISSEGLFLISRGSHSVGNVYYTQSDEEGDNVKFDIEIKYDANFDHFEAIKVCTVSRDEERGIGIFTPAHRRGEHHGPFHHLRFDVYVTFPKGASGALNLPRFTVDMPVFAQRIGDLSSIFFNLFKSSTAAGLFGSDSLHAKVIKVRNAAGSISGHFNTSSSLVLATANGAIDVTVDAHNVDPGKPTLVDMHTSHGAVTAAVSLISANDKGGSFNVSGATSMGRVALDFPTAPAESFLEARVSTTMGAAHVGLHETYEGHFIVSTTMGKTSLDFDASKEEERRRSVHVQRAGGTIEGDIFRSENGKKRGSVTVSTVMAAADITLI